MTENPARWSRNYSNSTSKVCVDTWVLPRISREHEDQTSSSALWHLSHVEIQGLENSSFKNRLRGRNLAPQIKVMDDSVGRYFIFQKGRIASGSGIHSDPDVVLNFSSAELATKLLLPSANQLDRINAIKNLRVELHGPDELTRWFTKRLSHVMAAGTEYGIALDDSSEGKNLHSSPKDDTLSMCLCLQIDRLFS